MKYEAKAWEDDNADLIVDDAELDITLWIVPEFTSDDKMVDLLTLSHTPVSQLARNPWDNTAEGAWGVCDNLNSEGTRGNIDSDAGNDGTFALTSNPEWMTIARNIEVQATNWTSGIVGTECLKRGNIGGSSLCNGVASGFNDAAATASSTDPLAKLVLSNGEEIWDFVGSLGEWVDWDTTGEFTGVEAGDKPYGLANGNQWNSIIEFTTVTENVAIGDIMFPDSWQASDPSYNSTQGIGSYREQWTVAFGYEGAATRGASREDVDYLKGGLYSLDLRFKKDENVYKEPTQTFAEIIYWNKRATKAFRCVYRP